MEDEKKCCGNGGKGGKKWWILAPIFGVAAIFGLSWVVMSLWNGLMPHLFNVPCIGYLEAIGLLILSKIFFGGFRAGWHKHHRGHHGKHCCGSNSLRDQWNRLSDSDKEALIQEWQASRGK